MTWKITWQQLGWPWFSSTRTGLSKAEAQEKAAQLRKIWKSSCRVTVEPESGGTEAVQTSLRSESGTSLSQRPPLPPP